MWVEKHKASWRIREEVAGQKVTIKSGFPTKTSARTAMIAMKTDRARGSFVDPRAGRITLSEWIDVFWPGYELTLKPSSQRSEGARVRTHIRPLLGKYRLDQLDALVMQDFVRALIEGEPDPERPGRWKRRPQSEKSVRNVHGVLHKVLGAAAQNRLLPANPATGTKMPAKQHREMRFLTPPEIQRLLAACSGEYAQWRPLVMLLVTTGLRFSEALALRVSRVDLFTRQLTVLQSAYNAGKGQYVYTEPKTAQSRRTVRFTPELALELTPLVAGKSRDDLLFTGSDGKAVTRNFRQRIWLKIRARAGLDGLRLHDLRHTVAALLISSGVPLTAVQRFLGHSSIKVTSDMYGHLMPEVHEGIVATMSNALNVGGSTSPMWAGTAGGVGGVWGDSVLASPDQLGSAQGLSRS